MPLNFSSENDVAIISLIAQSNSQKMERWRDGETAYGNNRVEVCYLPLAYASLSETGLWGWPSAINGFSPVGAPKPLAVNIVLDTG